MAIEHSCSGNSEHEPWNKSKKEEKNDDDKIIIIDAVDQSGVSKLDYPFMILHSALLNDFDK